MDTWVAEWQTLILDGSRTSDSTTELVRGKDEQGAKIYQDLNYVLLGLSPVFILSVQIPLR